jgi:hypothetical protein
MRNASRNYNHITTRHRFFHPARIIFVSKAETRFSLRNTEDFM